MSADTAIQTPKNISKAPSLPSPRPTLHLHADPGGPITGVRLILNGAVSATAGLLEVQRDSVWGTVSGVMKSNTGVAGLLALDLGCGWLLMVGMRRSPFTNAHILAQKAKARTPALPCLHRSVATPSTTMQHRYSMPQSSWL